MVKRLSGAIVKKTIPFKPHWLSNTDWWVVLPSFPGLLSIPVMTSFPRKNLQKMFDQKVTQMVQRVNYGLSHYSTDSTYYVLYALKTALHVISPLKRIGTKKQYSLSFVMKKGVKWGKLLRRALPRSVSHVHFCFVFWSTFVKKWRCSGYVMSVWQILDCKCAKI